MVVICITGLAILLHVQLGRYHVNWCHAFCSYSFKSFLVQQTLFIVLHSNRLIPTRIDLFVNMLLHQLGSVQTRCGTVFAIKYRPVPMRPFDLCLRWHGEQRDQDHWVGWWYILWTISRLEKPVSIIVTICLLVLNKIFVIYFFHIILFKLYFLTGTITWRLFWLSVDGILVPKSKNQIM